MKALLVGSKAASFWYRDFRPAKADYDLFVDVELLSEAQSPLRPLIEKAEDKIILGNDIVNVTYNNISYGFDNSKYESVRLFMDLNKGSPTIWLDGIQCHIATPETLMAIKRSHLAYRHQWQKHIEDYAFFQHKGVQIDEDTTKAMKVRMQERALRQDYKVSKSLATSNEEFFARSNKAVRRKFEHDDLHRVVAYHNEPLFERLKLDKSKAKLEHDLFLQLSKQDQLNLVREEAYVIGLERIIIPEWYTNYNLYKLGLPTNNKYRSQVIKAYEYALMRISTDLTSGWFRDFAIENYIALQYLDVNYVVLFEKAFEEGRLKLL